jgi:hypothetical protein
MIYHVFKQRHPGPTPTIRYLAIGLADAAAFCLPQAAMVTQNFAVLLKLPG